MNLTTKHKATLRQRLGKATDLIDDESYLPMFRNRQIHYEELFYFSMELANKKNNPKRYFSYIWGSSQLRKTLSWLQKLCNQAKSRAANVRNQILKAGMITKEQRSINPDGLRKLRQMKKSFNMLS